MYRYIIAIIVPFLLLGCQRHHYYDLEDYIGGVLTVKFDWDGYTDIPPGMNLYFYPIVDSDTKDYEYSGVPIHHQLQYDGGTVSLPVGRYNVVIFNDYTYNILYRGMDNYFSAEAYLDFYNRQPLASRSYSSINVSEPDIYYVAQIENLQISPNDGDRTITVRPILKTLKLFIHAKVKGQQYISKADCGINSASGGIILSSGDSREEECNRLFPVSINNEGLYGNTNMFLLNDPQSRMYEIEFAFLLRNNTVSMGKFKYDVTSQIVEALNLNDGNIPPEGIYVYVDGIEIDEVSTSGGFDASIDGWGDEININLE